MAKLSILIAEEEYMIAPGIDLAVEEVGAIVIGPYTTVVEASNLM